MLRSVRFLRQMGLGLIQNLNFGLREISLAPNPTIAVTVSSCFYLFLATMFAFLSLLCSSFLPRNLCVIPSLLILGLSLRRLSLWCDQFQRKFSLIWGKLTRFRKESCPNGGSCACCGSKMQSLKLKGSRKGSETERDKEVMELRKRLRKERKKRKEAMEEVEREREASAWASEEAMAKIMLLQSEKALVEREARQYREVMEKKQLHDKEVIDYLQLVVHSIWTERGGEEPDALRFVPDGDGETSTLGSGIE